MEAKNAMGAYSCSKRICSHSIFHFLTCQQMDDYATDYTLIVALKSVHNCNVPRVDCLALYKPFYYLGNSRLFHDWFGELSITFANPELPSQWQRNVWREQRGMVCFFWILKEFKIYQNHLSFIISQGQTFSFLK